MFVKEPKNNKEIYWTRHIKEKMRYYGISEGLLKRILRNPHRKEYGVAPDTIGIMQKAQSRKPGEVWLMYQEKSRRKKSSF